MGKLFIRVDNSTHHYDNIIIIIILTLILFCCIHSESATLDGLTIKDLNAVKNATWSARSKWYNLGLELGILADTLDVIKENCQNCEDCHIEMLKRWLKRSSPRPTWSALAKALRSLPVDEGALAKQLPHN